MKWIRHWGKMTRPLLSRELAVRVKAVRLIIAAVIFGLSLNLGDAANAQEQPPAPRPGGGSGGAGGDKKRTSKIDFEDELVEGELKKPELFYLLQKKQFNFKRLIKLREDFLPEMRRDGDEVRRSRSK
jgi:hypothetical protein